MSFKFFSANKKTFLFVISICFVAAAILSSVSLLLQNAKEKAQKLDKSKQLLIAAKLLSYKGFFLKEQNGKYFPAIYSPSSNTFVITKEPIQATSEQILQVYQKSIHLKFANKDGMLTAVEPTNATQKKLLVYEITLGKEEKPVGYVIPVRGFGLWDAIYGYIAIKPDGETVIGTTWYQQSETAGLGANIALADWQKQFEGKIIFEPSSTGEVNPSTSPIGIKVVKGKVSDVYPNSAKSKNAVDGISGASLTGFGVTKAYHNSLAPYRPFFVQLHKKKI